MIPAAAPPLLSARPARSRRFAPWAGGAVVAMALVWVAGHEPAGQFYYPRCAFHELTGWECPGCGATRALHALTRGEPAEAWYFNPMVFVGAAAAAAAAAFRLLAPPAAASAARPFHGWLLVAAAWSAAAFAVGRNL